MEPEKTQCMRMHISEHVPEDKSSLELETQNATSGGSLTPDHIVKPLQGMGIDNSWHDSTPEPSASSSMLDYTPGGSGLHHMSTPAMASEGASATGPVTSDQGGEGDDDNKMQLVLYQGSEWGKDDNGYAGRCGLKNLGNTCYMAAGLQCLAATPSMVRYFLSPARDNAGASCSGQNLLGSTTVEASKFGALTRHFSKLIDVMWRENLSSYLPAPFKQSLATTHTQFKGTHQQDCQEFLALLLDTLHQQLNTAGAAPHPPASEQPDKEEEEGAVAGCSSEEQAFSLDRESSPPSCSPTRSNIQIALQLEKSPLCHLDKNCLEQRRTPLLVTSPLRSPPLPSCSTPPLPSLVGSLALKDILKEARTSNVNVLAPQQCEPRPNNQIKFDSQKFTSNRISLATAAGTVPRGMRNSVSGRLAGDAGVVENPNNLREGKEGEGSCKRLKQTNLMPQQGSPPASEGRRDSSEDEASANTYKRMKLGTPRTKNKDEAEGGSVEMTSLQGEGVVDEEQQIEADTFWQTHLSANQSVIVDSFQGQFRSTVVCSECQHVSVTYEPFMYLSVPLPHALERQFYVTLVPAQPGQVATRYLVCLNKDSQVRELRVALVALAGLDPGVELVMCEGLEHHVSRIMEPTNELSSIQPNRCVYAFEMAPPPLVQELTQLSGDGESMECEATPPPLDLTPGGAMSQQRRLPKCTICLEEVELEARPLRHGDSCDCVLCASCLEECKAHQAANGSILKCPVCHVEVDGDSDFVVIEAGSSVCQLTSGLRTLSIVFRVDVEGEEYNNKRSSRLYGLPRVVRVPCRISGEQLYETLAPFAPSPDFLVMIVEGKGLLCGSCMYGAHCHGCILSRDSPELVLTNLSTLAVRTVASRCDDVPSTPPVTDNESTRAKRKSEHLSLYDCLNAFTKSETLDLQNPWFCPRCETNRTATKTLSVWRYPQIVIVYLKRFIFHKSRSTKLDNKVTFPLNGLQLTQAGGGAKATDNIYNLYSCVCHYGSPTCGHYTAYAKHPQSSEWYYYNDETVLRKRPSEEDHNNAYILFYQRDNSPELII